MRDCNKCIYHISGSCSAWECEMQTLEDYRNKVIDEFAKRLKEKSIDMEHLGNDTYGSISWRDIDEIAKEMRGVK